MGMSAYLLLLLFGVLLLLLFLQFGCLGVGGQKGLDHGLLQRSTPLLLSQEVALQSTNLGKETELWISDFLKAKHESHLFRQSFVGPLNALVLRREEVLAGLRYVDLHGLGVGLELFCQGHVQPEKTVPEKIHDLPR